MKRAVGAAVDWHFETGSARLAAFRLTPDQPNAHKRPKPAALVLTKEGARKAVATMKRKGVLSAKARKAWATRRAGTTSKDFEDFASRLVAMLKATPAGSSLKEIKDVAGFSDAKLRRLVEMNVIGESGGRYSIQKDFLEEFRQENLERKKVQIEEMEVREYLEKLEAEAAAKKRPAAGVA